MKCPRIPQLAMTAALATLALLFGPLQCQAQYIPTSGPGSALSIPQAPFMQPDVLNNLLQPKKTTKPLLLQVGSHLLFDEAHIPGSVYAGAGSQPTGLQQLQRTGGPSPRKTG